MKKIKIWFAVIVSWAPLHCSTAGETQAPGGDCARTTLENPSLCMDPGCAARAKAELDRALACHKKKMAELAAGAEAATRALVGGNK